MKKISLLSTAILLAISCNKQTIEVDPTPTVDGLIESTSKGCIIEVSVAETNESSRIAVDPTGDTWNATWEETDALMGYFAPAGDTKFTNYSTFAMEEYGEEVSTFNGTSELAGYQRRLIYYPGASATDSESMPYIYNNDTGEIWVDATIAEQVEGIHSTYMMDPELVVVEDSECAPISMKHVGAVADLHLRFTNAPEGSYLTGVEVQNVINAAYLKVAGTIEDEDLYIETFTGSINVAIEQRAITNYSSEEDEVSIKFNIFEFDLASGASVDIKLSFADVSGYPMEKVVSITNNSDSAISFQKATYNTWNCLCDMSDVAAETATITLAELSADNIPEEDVWIITDSEAASTDFAGFAAAVKALNDTDRAIAIEFPNMTYIPDYIVIGTGKYDYSTNYSILSVSAPIATEIGIGALRNCDGLVSANFPQVTTAGNYLFASCLVLAEVNMPLLESVGTYTFQYCKALTALDLPELTTSSTDFCNGCSALVSINMPKLTTTSTNAFNNCDALTEVNLPSLETVGKLGFYDCDALTSISLPSVTSVGDNAFSSSDLLASIELPSVVTFGLTPIYYCHNLTSFTIGENVATMGGGLLSGCDGLTEVNCLNPNFVIEDNILYDAAKTTAYSAVGLLNVGAVVLPESVTAIAASAFWYSDNITSFTAPSVVTVGDLAFNNCTSLSSVSLPSVTTIGANLFNSKYNALVTSLSLATSPGVKLESIGYSMFYSGYSGYSNLTIGSANEEYVSGNTLTVGTESITFGSITIADDASGVEDLTRGATLGEF